MKKAAFVILLFIFSVSLMAQKIDTTAIVKAGFSKLIKDYSLICFKDSSKVNARWYVQGKDTVVQAADKEPPRGYTYLGQREVMVHKPFMVEEFFNWIIKRKD